MSSTAVIVGTCLTSPSVVEIAVKVSSNALRVFVNVSRLPPESIVRPRVDVTVRVDDWDEVEVVV